MPTLISLCRYRETRYDFLCRRRRRGPNMATHCLTDSRGAKPGEIRYKQYGRSFTTTVGSVAWAARATDLWAVHWAVEESSLQLIDEGKAADFRTFPR